MGRRGELFKILKIRSMHLDAEKDGVQWASPDDHRRLKIGAFLRQWNIDEVPQFWNVLKGEMSLVGPRPERPELIKDFKDQIRHYNARHNVKPGMTGWAQIHACAVIRNSTNASVRFLLLGELDADPRHLYYVHDLAQIQECLLGRVHFRTEGREFQKRGGTTPFVIPRCNGFACPRP